LAKLKGPLFSLGAAGAIGEALVYFGWKGLNVVREYVIPANPKTDAQNTQRGYLTEAVEYVHNAQSTPTDPLTAADISAYALLGSIHPTPRTWFNEVIKQWIDQKVASLTPVIWRDGETAEQPGQLLTSIRRFSGVPTASTFWYGTSKTALIYSKAATVADPRHFTTITGLTKGVKYYWQLRPTAPAGVVGSNSGIYYGVPT